VGDLGHHGVMADRAELSSLTATLEELLRRVGQLTDKATEAGDDEASSELVSLERGLQSSLRRMRRLLK
jgi:ElaB/YqjD/DUF883 family membrane-anchored ribosome-binding protein